VRRDRRKYFQKIQGEKISILSPLVRGRKGHYRELFEEVRKKGFLKVRVDGEVKDLTPKMQLDRYKIHDIELVVDRLKVTPDLRTRISQSVQQALKLGKDLMFVQPEETPARVSHRPPTAVRSCAKTPASRTKSLRRMRFLSTRRMARALPAKAWGRCIP
jgi:excinuclease UvrABC ATPase subunit